MENLPKLVDTYKNVCGDNNPFEDVLHIDAYGFDADICQSWMLAFNSDLPVMNDYSRLHMQILLTCMENDDKYIAMFGATQIGLRNPLQQINYTDTVTHTGTVKDGKAGTETSTRTGNVADSGTDTTTDGTTVTDSAVTYDNGTFRDTGKSVSSGSGSIVHGKTTTYNNVADAKTFANREDTRTFNDTVTHSVVGFKTNPSEILAKYTEFIKNNLVFYELISDVKRAISCIVYIPFTPENEEE